MESESDAEGSEDYQEDFEVEEEQSPSLAEQKKNSLRPVGSGIAGRKV